MKKPHLLKLFLFAGVVLAAPLRAEEFPASALPAQAAAETINSTPTLATTELNPAGAGQTLYPPKIKLVYPRENAKLPFVKNSFVFGSVEPSSAQVFINGAKIPVYRTGSFLAYIPFNPGEFQITAQAILSGTTAEVARTVTVNTGDAPLPSHPLQIVKESIVPAADEELTDGEWLRIRFQGSANCQATYRINDLRKPGAAAKWHPLAEKSPGIYFASQILHYKESLYRVEFKLTGPSKRSIRALAPGKIKVIEPDPATTAEVIADDTILRTGPALQRDTMSYFIFLPKETKLRYAGRSGSEIRIKLSDSLYAWTDEKHLKITSQSPTVPHTVLDAIRDYPAKENSFIAALELHEKVPFQARVSDDMKTLTLTLYYTVSNLDRIHYDSAVQEKWLGQIRWEQTETETTQVEFNLKEKIWGYDFRYEGKKLLLEIVLPPRTKKRIRLSDLTIAVDPGHSPDLSDGTIGPQGIKESEVNFNLAKVLKEDLEKFGARVILTKNETEAISLVERTTRAWESGAQLFISLHQNALADGENPFTRGGYSVFYFQPFSYDLAKAVHEAYQKNIPLKDDGFYYGNLAVCRATQMPAILVESGYLILPEEEELLLRKEFLIKLSDSIVEGINKYLEGLTAN